MIDHVEEHLFEHSYEIGKFDHEKTVVCEKFPDITDHGLNIVDMGEDIVGADSIRFAVILHDLANCFLIKITVQGHSPVPVCLLGKIFSRLNPNPAHSNFVITGNKQAIVTADINNEWIVLFRQTVSYVIGIF